MGAGAARAAPAEANRKPATRATDRTSTTVPPKLPWCARELRADRNVSALPRPASRLDLEIVVDHHANQLFEADRGLPPKDAFRLRRIAEEQVDLSGPHIPLIDTNVP